MPVSFGRSNSDWIESNQIKSKLKSNQQCARLFLLPREWFLITKTNWRYNLRFWYLYMLVWQHLMVQMKWNEEKVNKRRTPNHIIYIYNILSKFGRVQMLRASWPGTFLLNSVVFFHLSFWLRPDMYTWCDGLRLD